MLSKFFRLIGLVFVSLIYIRPTLNIPIFSEIAVFLSAFCFLLFPYTGINRKFAQLVYSYIPILYLTWIYLFFYDFVDLELFRRVSRSILDLLAGYFLYSWLVFKLNTSPKIIFITLVFSALIQAIVMILMFASVPFYDFIKSFIAESPRFVPQERISGFQALGGDSLSMNQVLASILCLQLLLNYKVNKFLYWLILLLILISSLLAGRTGFFIFIFLIFGYYLIMLIFTNRAIRFVRYSLLVLMLILVLKPIVVERATDFSYGYNDPFFRALEPVRNYVLHGSFKTNTGSALTGRFLIFPDSIDQILFGDGQFGRDGTYKLDTDIGYLRILFGIGIIGSIIAYLPFFYVYYVCYKYQKYIYINKINHGLLILLCVVTFGFIGHLKILYLFSGSFTFVLAIMFVDQISQTMNKINMTNFENR